MFIHSIFEQTRDKNLRHICISKGGERKVSITLQDRQGMKIKMFIKEKKYVGDEI